jgi:hypothetical protein
LCGATNRRAAVLSSTKGTRNGEDEDQSAASRSRGCDILVERDHRRRPFLGARSPAIASRAIPAKSNNAARGDMVSSWWGNSPPRTDTPSESLSPRQRATQQGCRDGREHYGLSRSQLRRAL